MHVSTRTCLLISGGHSPLEKRSDVFAIPFHLNKVFQIDFEPTQCIPVLAFTRVKNKGNDQK